MYRVSGNMALLQDTQKVHIAESNRGSACKGRGCRLGAESRPQRNAAVAATATAAAAAAEEAPAKRFSGAVAAHGSLLSPNAVTAALHATYIHTYEYYNMMA